jgi:hypothetical protein
MFKIGNYVEISPKTEMDFLLKRNGVPNTGIVISVDESKETIFVEVWRDEIAEMDRALTTMVPASQVVLIKDKDDPNMRHAFLPKN